MVSEKTRQKILTATEKGKPLSIKTFSFLPHAQQYIDSMLQIFLDDLGIPVVMDQLSYCIKELAVNAKKANTKRLYFEEKGLNLQDDADYELGMENFKTDTLNNQTLYLRLLKEKDYYVKIEFLRYQDSCSIAVRNNVEILPGEKARVLDKIRKARLYDSLEDALSEVLDESEGAGLGILVLVLMLKRLGFDGDFFQVYTMAGETIARIILPLNID